MPTKGHHGPVGPIKCFYGLLLSLTSRVDELERLDRRSKTQQLEDMEKLGLERQTALLVTISSLEDTVAKLQDRLVLVESSRHSVPETSRTVVISQSPAPGKPLSSPPSSPSISESPPPDNPKMGLSPDPSTLHVNAGPWTPRDYLAEHRSDSPEEDRPWSYLSSWLSIRQ